MISDSGLSVGFSSGSSMDTKFLYIQMELCVGDTLRGWIEKRNSLNEDNITERRREAAHICSQILQAVKCIHSKDLIHRDLKVNISNPFNSYYSTVCYLHLHSGIQFVLPLYDVVGLFDLACKHNVRQ